MDRDRIAVLATLGGAVLLVVGSFLGWATLLGRTVTGTGAGDGWMSAAAAVVVGAYAVRVLLEVEPLPLWFAWAGLVVAIGVAGVNLLEILDTGGDDVAVGFGMVVMVLGGLIGVVGLALHSVGRRSTQTK